MARHCGAWPGLELSVAAVLGAALAAPIFWVVLQAGLSPPAAGLLALAGAVSVACLARRWPVLDTGMMSTGPAGPLFLGDGRGGPAERLTGCQVVDLGTVLVLSGRQPGRRIRLALRLGRQTAAVRSAWRVALGVGS